MEGKPRPTSAASTPTRRSMKQQTLTSMSINAPATPPRNAASPGSGGVLAAEESKRTTRAAAQLTPTRTPTSTASVTSNGVAVTTKASPSRARTRVVVTPMVATPRTPLLRPRRSQSAHSVGLRDPYEQHTLEALKEECARRGLSMQPRDHPLSDKPVRFTKTQYVELLQEADMLAMFERQSSSRRGSGSSTSAASGSRKRASRKVEMTPPAPLRVVAVAARPAATATATATPASTASTTAPAAAKAAAKPANAAKPKRVYAPRKKAATAASTSLPAASSQTKPSESTVTIANPPTIVRGSMTAAAAEPIASMELEEKRPVLVVAAKPKPTETVDLTEEETTTTTTTSNAASSSQSSPAKPQQTTAPVSEKPPVVTAAVAEKKTAAPTALTPTSVSPAKPSTAAPAPPAAPAAAKPVPAKAAPAAKPSTTTTAAARAKKKPTAAASTAASAAASSASPEPPVGTASTFRSAIRARRGCRFRLINVLMSPDFNTRWREMHVVPPGRGDVNVFWRDAHISFLCQNSFYDKLHFVDPLFDNVAPEVIQNHTAQKLQQMWSEIVTMYRRTWNQAKRSAEPKPFLDSCAGRLDLLYLHMGLLLEPELHKAIVNDAVPPRPRPPFVVSNEAATVTMVGPAPTKAPISTFDDSTPAKKPEAARKPAASARSTDNSLHVEDLQLDAAASSAYGQPPRFVELKNPDMLPSWLLEDQAKTAVERGLVSSMPATSSSLAASPAAPFPAAASSAAKGKKPRASRAKKPAAASPGSASKARSPSPVKTRDLVLHSSAINSIDDDSASSDYETNDNNTPAAQSTQRRAAGKRRRGAAAADDAASTTDLVEVPTSRELVPHPHKRLHTTAVTTTLTRSSVAPDEFDVMHHRLRKVNESIDQCYRTLANSEAILNDMHREDVEADLRFYFGIKKRIQEQIVMFMHGF